ncbi:MAG: DNA polymerase III subunit beta [bacterium]|nr:DNA polymerase III subunit beta [bacterium]
MKFTTSSATWQRGIAAVQPAVGSAISNPILENIFISCDENKVSFIGTNLSVTFRCDGEAQIETPGSTTVPAKIIIGQVQSLPQDDVVFTESDQSIDIKCARFSAKMKGQDAALFPPFNQVVEGVEFSMPVSRLKSIVRKTMFATSQEKSRYELDGVKFDIKDGVMMCVATDGRRLSMCRYEGEEAPKETLSVLIPSKTLQVIQTSLPDDGEAAIRIHERKIQVSCGDSVIVSNLLVDNFPQYDRIVPPEGKIKIMIDRGALMASIKRASNLTSIETSMLVFKLNKGSLEIVGEREEVGGSGRDVIETDYDGDPMEIRFNYKYLADALRSMEEEKVEIELTDSRKPGIFRSVGDDSYKYVLMPMRPPDEEETPSA